MAKKRLAVFGLLSAGVVAFATPAQAYPCDRVVHIETGMGVHICLVDKP